MTQIMLDVTTASVKELREAVKFITACANLRDGTDSNPLQLLPADVAAPLPAARAPAPPAAPLVAVDTTTQPLGADTVYDSTGMPWDDRIHQSGKGQKKNGEWKLKKGIDLGIVEQVTKELHARKAVTVAAPATTAAAPDEDATAAPAPPPVPLPPTTAAAVPIPPAVPAAPPPAIATTPAAPAAAPISGYRAFLSKVVAATKSGKVTQEEVSAIVTKNGAPSIAMLNSLAHLIPAVEQDLDILLIERA